jgi:hypothetical protein
MAPNTAKDRRAMFTRIRATVSARTAPRDAKKCDSRDHMD